MIQFSDATRNWFPARFMLVGLYQCTVIGRGRATGGGISKRHYQTSICQQWDNVSIYPLQRQLIAAAAVYSTVGPYQKMDSEDKDPDRPQRIADKAKEISEFFGERQRHYARQAQDFGYSRELLDSIGTNFRKLPDNPAFSGTEEALGKFHLFVRAREAQSDALRIDVSSASYALSTTVSSTAGVVALPDMKEAIRKMQMPPPKTWSRDRTELYASKLEKLDPELGRLARSVWHTYYSGVEGAVRNSLFAMRQLYDHFIAHLAPDDDVRKSRFFRIKTGNAPDQVHRRERLLYAASVHVSDQSLGELLSSETDQVLKNYERLNLLHSRGPLDSQDVKEPLLSMQAVIEQWVDAIGL